MDSARPSFIVRAIDSKDLGSVIGAIITVRTSAYMEWNGPKSAEEKQAESRIWQDKIASRNGSAMFIASKDAEMAGYVWGYETEPKRFYISHIGVREDCKGQGLGRILVQQCEELARLRGCVSISTSTYNRFHGMLILLVKEGYLITAITKREGDADKGGRIEFEKALS